MKSKLRADVQAMKEQHLFRHLDKQIKSTKQLMEVSKNNLVAGDGTMSATDRFDLKAYQNNQYFPQPEQKITEEDKLMAKREELGLNVLRIKKHYSVQDEDEEPRYEISKVSNLARIDLDETNLQNLDEQERLYGDGKAIEDEIIKQNRSNSQTIILPDKKQLEGHMTQFLKFREGLEANLKRLSDAAKEEKMQKGMHNITMLTKHSESRTSFTQGVANRTTRMKEPSRTQNSSALGTSTYQSTEFKFTQEQPQMSPSQEGLMFPSLEAVVLDAQEMLKDQDREGQNF